MSKEEALKAFEQMLSEIDKDNWLFVGTINPQMVEWAVPLCEISDAPSIDIVRCKECKHRPIKEDADGENYGFNVIAPNGDERCPCLVEDGWYSWIPKDDFYCGYGEREGE